MPTYRTIYPKKFIDPQMLHGHPPQSVTIETVTVEDFYNKFSKQNIQKIVLAFAGKQARLALNITQAEALAGITRTDDYERWIGHMIRLTTGKAPNGKLTIVILPPEDRPSAPHPDPDPEPEIDEDEPVEEVTAEEIDELFAD